MKNKFKNAVIFGASQGIGKALALEYAKDDTTLLLLSKNEKGIAELSGEITAKGKICYYSYCDISKKDDVAKGIKFAVEKLGAIDLVIINSGVGLKNWMENFSSDALLRMIEVNTFGIAHVLEYLIPIMKKQGYGTIAGVSSLSDIRGYSGSTSYSASKAAASILLEGARIELKEFNIKVVTVRPGFVKTAMTDKNEFKMPFMMQTDKAARIIKRGIEKGKSIVQFPFFTVNATRLIKFLPNWLFDWGMKLARPVEKK
ncbi:MAG: SDR family NAD(P)-dependent oxidoreductase [Ignavibacteria bacterium]